MEKMRTNKIISDSQHLLNQQRVVIRNRHTRGLGLLGNQARLCLAGDGIDLDKLETTAAVFENIIHPHRTLAVELLVDLFDDAVDAGDFFCGYVAPPSSLPNHYTVDFRINFLLFQTRTTVLCESWDGQAPKPIRLFG
jgi:hypothetical protein